MRGIAALPNGMKQSVILPLLLCATSVFAQTTPPLPADPGVKTGARIPRFQLKDQNGKTQSLESLRGPKGLMLVFYRSADW
ncbi:MAG: redoxin domain-containing protein [Bryobacterales bacterium]|nr:redoxin domain-containing protein [Bryobacterales bacterium]